MVIILTNIDNPFWNNAWLIVYVRWKNERRSPHFRAEGGHCGVHIFLDLNEWFLKLYFPESSMMLRAAHHDRAALQVRQTRSFRNMWFWNLATFKKIRLVMVNLKAIWNSFQLKMVLKNARRTLQFFQPFSLSSSRFFIAIFFSQYNYEKIDERILPYFRPFF